MKYRCIGLIALALLGCDDKKPGGGAPTTANAAAQPPPSVTSAAAEPLQLEGVAEAKKEGPQLQYRQTFDAGHILDVTLCEDRVFTLAAGGRIVEWDRKTAMVKGVLRDFSAVTSIDAHDGVLLAGTDDGRLVRTPCSGRDPVVSPEPTLPVRWVALDVRSRKRGFVVYEQAATPKNKLQSTAASVALVDLETGRAPRDPFRRPWPNDGRVFGFVDYRGELWFGTTPDQKPSTMWYLERFDETQPEVSGLGEVQIAGLLQVSRQVWAFGGTVDQAQGRIFRVDSRTKVLWDGEKAWFGEQPGGELPRGPIRMMHELDGAIFIASNDAVYRADKELRRWKRLESNEPLEDVFATATAPVELDDRILVGTHAGLIVIEWNGWSRMSVPQSEPREQPTALKDSATWRGTTFSIDDHDRLAIDGKKPRARPRRDVHGFYVDQRDRLFVFADQKLWMMSGFDRGEQVRWDARSIGVAPAVVSGAGPGPDDSMIVSTRYGAQFRLRVAPATSADR